MDDFVRLENGVTAVQYGTPEGLWEKRALIKVAAFVTGLNLSKDSITDDQLLDVVTPVEQFWKPEQNVADIQVAIGGHTLGMTLGQWLIKYPTGHFRVLSTNDYLSQVGPPKKALSFRKELENLLNKHGLDAATRTPDDILAETVERFIDLLGINNSQTKYRENA